MDIVNFPNGFRPTGADFLEREQKKIAEFGRLREQLGRGVVTGLQLTRQSNGSITLGAGHGSDANANAIVVPQTVTLDLSGVAMPRTGKFKWVAVLLKYKQIEKGQAQGVASGTWAEKIDSYEVELVAGAEADTKGAAVKPVNTTKALRVGDILFDDNGTRLADNSAAEKLAWKAYADRAEQDAIAEAVKKDGALEAKLQTNIDKKASKNNVSTTDFVKISHFFDDTNDSFSNKLHPGVTRSVFHPILEANWSIRAM